MRSKERRYFLLLNTPSNIEYILMLSKKFSSLTEAIETLEDCNMEIMGYVPVLTNSRQIKDNIL